MHVEPATPESFERVLSLLRRFEQGTTHLSGEHWQRLFSYPWKAPDETRGFLLMDGETVVGFEGFIHHHRTIEGRRHWLANGSTWVVLPEYRRHSLMLRRAWMEKEAAGRVTSTGHSVRPDLAYYRCFSKRIRPSLNESRFQLPSSFARIDVGGPATRPLRKAIPFMTGRRLNK